MIPETQGPLTPGKKQKVILSLTKNLSAANVSENLQLSLWHFCDGRKRRKPTIICTASYTLVIKWSRVLKKNIMWMAEAVTRMCSIKRCSYKFCNIKRKISVPETPTPAFNSCEFVNSLCFLKNIPGTNASVKALDFTKNGSNS